ncbi:hypothetical protein BC938DRAFT_483307 [Jimgerdemannia flammicorona]|uniref:Cytochrome P450 n=1 Tax=Jimgerdemannia flammicorona TaxID=994334 RepID=A0A433QVS0_9FUNG|nr:hypothetical protein BC938DRAFT_483307 [Jimgerdemannia flammicorona]
MPNLIPNIIFGSHPDVTSTQILGYGISLAVALYLAQRWVAGNKSFDLDYMLRVGKKSDIDLHELIAKHITPNLKAYTPRVVRKLRESMDNWLGGVQDCITIEKPVVMIQDMVAIASTHACPGRFFAIQEIKTIVSIIMRKSRIVRPTPSASRSIKEHPEGPLMFIKRE